MITISPIGTIFNEANDQDFNGWDNLISEIMMLPPFDDRHLKGIEKFGKLEIIFYDHKSPKYQIPKDSPTSGVFSSATGPRPNNLYVSVVQLVRKKEGKLLVSGLRALNGSPVIDIKPVI